MDKRSYVVELSSDEVAASLGACPSDGGVISLGACPSDGGVMSLGACPSDGGVISSGFWWSSGPPPKPPIWLPVPYTRLVISTVVVSSAQFKV